MLLLLLFLILLALLLFLLLLLLLKEFRKQLFFITLVPWCHLVPLSAVVVADRKQRFLITCDLVAAVVVVVVVVVEVIVVAVVVLQTLFDSLLLQSRFVTTV